MPQKCSISEPQCSTFALFYPSKQTCARPHGQPHPALARRRQAPTRESGTRPAHRLPSSYGPISPDLAGSQPSRQAPPRWIGHKLRFCLPLVLCLIEGSCRPRGQSAAPDAMPSARARAPWAGSPYGTVSSRQGTCPLLFGRLAPGDFWRRKAHGTHSNGSPRS